LALEYNIIMIILKHFSLISLLAKQI